MITKPRPSPKHLFALSLLALAAQASAANYYMVAPLRSAKSTAAAEQPPGQSVSLTLASFVPTPGAEGAPYQLDLRGLTQLTGGSLDAVTYSVAGGALPAGLTLGSNGQISGTPTGPTPAEGQLVTVQASYQGKTAQQSYLFSMEAMSITLATATLPEAQVGKPYSFDFRSLATVKGGTGIANATFARQGSALPQGLALGADGVLAGTPAAGSVTTGAGTSFTVIGTYLSKTGQQVYTIKVGDAVFEAVQVAAGDYHTCAVTTGGSLKCWGYNGYGQLGDGTATARDVPVQVMGLASDVQSVAVSPAHTCAVTTSGTAKCWGNNGYGQLGDGTTVNKYTPVQVQALAAGLMSVAVGRHHTCAIASGGAVVCWGSGGNGELGDGKMKNSTTPVTAQGLGAGVQSIAAGANHTCAVTSSGTLQCWGHNGHGQLGDGTMTLRPAPVGVQGLDSGVQSVAIKYLQTCAVTTSGALKCWGWNAYGQLGDGTKVNKSAPVQVQGLASGVMTVAVGSYHTCAITTGGSLKCWGYNGGGGLGDGTTTQRTTPVQVQGLTAGAQSVVAGSEHTCAIASGGALKCWGENTQGQLGDGTNIKRPSPVSVKGN